MQQPQQNKPCQGYNKQLESKLALLEDGRRIAQHTGNTTALSCLANRKGNSLKHNSI